MWRIIKGRSVDGSVEYQVSDGDVDERTESYDFSDLSDAEMMLKELNRELLPKIAYGGCEMNKPYHNEGFGKAFFVVFLLLVPLPILALWLNDGQDWADRFTTKYFSPWQSECWETAKHERVCKSDNNCKFWRNFCHEE